jgi:hypothetical protein
MRGPIGYSITGQGNLDRSHNRDGAAQRVTLYYGDDEQQRRFDVSAL